MLGRSLARILLLVSLALLAPAAASAALHVVHNGDSIQDAVDAASPGDTIFVLPGVYTAPPGADSVVNVQTSDLRLIGSSFAVIDATDIEYGVMVGPDAPINEESGCPAIAVTDFTIRGFTIRDAGDTGVRLVGVDRYRMSHGRYIDNAEYGPFPVCSTNGVISHNFARGHDDAAIYVGDDDGVRVFENVVTDSTIGIEIENSSNVVMRNNLLVGNTAGSLIIVLPSLPMPFTDTVLVRNNWIVGNNRDNPVPSGNLATLPVGTGILNIGGDNVTIQGNFIANNDSFGIATIGNFFSAFDPRIEPFVDGNVTVRNAIIDNGTNPDPLRALWSSADIVFIPDLLDPTTGMIVAMDPDPTDNCYANNNFGSDYPPGVTGLFPCP